MTAHAFDLTGRVAVVTGGNGGIGLAYARGLARQGAHLNIWGRNQDKNQAAQAELAKFGHDVRTECIDVTNETDVNAGMARAFQAHGRLDCVVVNAGQVVYAKSFLEVDGPAFRAVLDTNLNGAYYTMRAAGIHMKDQFKASGRGGSIIVCGSLAIFAGHRGLEHYGAAKGGLNSVVKSMATELGRYQVRVNMVAPGFIKTAGRDEEETDIQIAKRHPLGRVGTPEDLEGIAVYLASNASAFHTGDTLTVDGGWMASIF